jgi:hypothetical protein
MANSKVMVSKVMVNKATASNKVVKVMVSKSQITTASSSKADTASQVKETSPEDSEAASSSNKAVKPMANNNVVQLMVPGNMAKDRAKLDSNNKATASKVMINKVKATADQAAPRKVTAAS